MQRVKIIVLEPRDENPWHGFQPQNDLIHRRSPRLGSHQRINFMYIVKPVRNYLMVMYIVVFIFHICPLSKRKIKQKPGNENKFFQAAHFGKIGQ